MLMFPFKYEGLFVLMDQLQKVQMSQRWFGNQKIYTFYQKKMIVMKQTFKSLNIFWNNIFVILKV
jgi:hypothetical protein